MARRIDSRISRMWRVDWRDGDGRDHYREAWSATEGRTLLVKQTEAGGTPISEPVELENRWGVRWRDAAARPHKKVFGTLREAKEHLHDEDGRRRRNETSPRASDGRRLFAEAAQDVAATRSGRRASTRARDESLMRSLILPTFGDVQLRNISGTMVESWIGSLVTRRCAPATIRKAFQLLGGVMRYAARKRWILRSPLEDVDLAEILPKDDHVEQCFLGAEDISRLADAIDPRFRSLILTAGFSGLRFGELAGLKVGRIDFLRRRLSVVESVNEVRGEIVTTSGKTKGSRRVVSIPAFLVEMLAEEVKGRSAEDYVFSSPGGGPLRRNAFRSRFWIPATIAAGLPHQFTRTRRKPLCLCGLAEEAPSHEQPVRFHDLRHSHAAMLIGQGVHVKAIADRLGHASIRTTMDVYGHLLEGIDQGAAEGLDALYRGTEVPNPAAVVGIGRSE